MANKEGNSYTIIYSIVMVVVVGTALAALAILLKPMQDANTVVKKKIDILAAVGITADRKNAKQLYAKHIITNQSIVIDINGKLKSKVQAFDVDVQAQYKDKTLKENDKNYPLFVAINKKGDTNFIVPVIGVGLWGPIWGYISLGSDKTTIVGASFDHKTETPGLGAEINQDFFENRWLNEKVSETGFQVVKDNSGNGINGKIDGITGGTITSKGVEAMMNACLPIYMSYFNKNTKLATK
jgi:Na+-transporting NADH:ubiquinone oxidoreductase subunit C